MTRNKPKEPNFTLGEHKYVALRKRMYLTKKAIGTWRQYAKVLTIKNHKYVYEFVLYGIMPANEDACKKIGVPFVCHACGRPRRQSSAKKITPQAEEYERWWWKQPRPKRHAIMRREWQKDQEVRNAFTDTR